MTGTPVWVVGVGMTPFGVQPDVSVKDLTQHAVRHALADAGVQLGDIQAAYFGNTCQDILEGQIVVAGQITLRSMGFERIPMVNVENACATGATALHQADPSAKLVGPNVLNWNRTCSGFRREGLWSSRWAVRTSRSSAAQSRAELGQLVP